MDRSTLGLYLYMNTSEPIIKWLEQEGCTTEQKIISVIEPMIDQNIHNLLNKKAGTALGTASCLRNVIKHFKKTKK